MRAIDGIRSYLLDNELKITILKNKIDILNYKDIGHFDSDKVVVKHSSGSIIVKGENLVVSKLMSDEILITGEYSIIEFR